MLDPVIGFSLLGLAAGLLRSELRLPPAIDEVLSVLLLAIGLEGGMELATQPFGTLLPLMLAVLAAVRRRERGAFRFRHGRGGGSRRTAAVHRAR